jgi:alkylation response protein AidB-like acyl-CoA dehydrogenase
MIRSRGLLYSLRSDDDLFDMLELPDMASERDPVRAFVRDRLNPGAHARDRACEAFPRALLEQAGALGMFGTGLPEALGGQARGWADTSRELWVLSRDCEEMAFPFILSYQQSLVSGIHSAGRPDLLPLCRAMARGERFGSFGWSESSDAFSFRTVVRRTAAGIVIDGVKAPVSGALFSDVFVVYARDEARGDVIAVLVERGDPGVEIVEMEPLGLRALGQGELRMTGVELVSERILIPSDALSHAQVFLSSRRSIIPCFVLGRLEAFFEATASDLSSRMRYGLPASEMQAVQAVLGRMWAQIETCRALVERMLHRLGDSDERSAADRAWDPAVAATKYAVMEQARAFLHDAQNILGGRWYYAKWPFGRWMRDILGMIPAAGTQAILEVDIGMLASSEVTRRRRTGHRGQGGRP